MTLEISPCTNQDSLSDIAIAKSRSDCAFMMLAVGATQEAGGTLYLCHFGWHALRRWTQRPASVWGATPPGPPACASTWQCKPGWVACWLTWRRMENDAPRPWAWQAVTRSFSRSSKPSARCMRRSRRSSRTSACIATASWASGSSAWISSARTASADRFYTTGHQPDTQRLYTMAGYLQLDGTQAAHWKLALVSSGVVSLTK